MQDSTDAFIKAGFIITLFILLIVMFEINQKDTCDKTKTLILDGEVYHCEAIHYDDNTSSEDLQRTSNLHGQEFATARFQQLNEDS